MSFRLLLLVSFASCGAFVPRPDAGVDAGELPAFAPQSLGAEDAMTLACGGATMNDGTVFVVGTTTGALDPAGRKGQRDFFLARYAPDGTRAWVRQLGTNAPFPGFYVSACSVRADALGNTFVSGTANGLGSFEGKPLPNVYSAFVARFDAFGQLVWLEIIGGAGGATEAMSVELLPDDRLVVAGYTRAPMLGDAAGLGEGDVFLAFFSRLGARETVRRIGGPGEDVPSGFDVDGNRLFLATRVLSGAAGAVTAQALRELDVTGTQVRELALVTGDRFTVAGLSATDAGLGLLSQQVLEDGGLGGYRLEWRDEALASAWTQARADVRRPVYAFDCDVAHGCAVGGSSTVGPDGGVGALHFGYVDLFDRAGQSSGSLWWSDGAGSAATRVTFVDQVRDDVAVAGFGSGVIEGQPPVGLADTFVRRVARP